VTSLLEHVWLRKHSLRTLLKLEGSKYDMEDNLNTPCTPDVV